MSASVIYNFMQAAGEIFQNIFFRKLGNLNLDEGQLPPESSGNNRVRESKGTRSGKLP